MSWENPKTNWGQAGQTVPGVDDFNRIEGNIDILGKYDRAPGYGTATGTNTKAITLSPAPSSYYEGLCFAFKNSTQNTGAVTINVNGLGAKAIKKPNGNDLVSGNLKAGSVYTVRYNGTNFILQGSDSSGNATPGDVRAGKTFSSDAGTDLVGTFMPISLTENLGTAISYSDSRHINFFNLPSISGDIPQGSSKSVTFTAVREYPNINRDIYIYARRRKINVVSQSRFYVSVYDNTDSVYLIQDEIITFNSGETTRNAHIDVRLSQLYKNHSYTITVTGLIDPANNAGILNSAIFYVGDVFGFNVYVDKSEFSIR